MCKANSVTHPHPLCHCRNIGDSRSTGGSENRDVIPAALPSVAYAAKRPCHVLFSLPNPPPSLIHFPHSSAIKYPSQALQLHLRMVEEKKAKGEVRRRKSSTGFKGVRMRKWGRWVSEIRVPKSCSRVWLGSYDSPEKAARAYDAALYCLRGPGTRFNFPEERRPELPGGMPPLLAKADLKTIAASFTCSEDPTAGLSYLGSACMSFLMAGKASPSPELLPASSEMVSGCEAGSEVMAPAGGCESPDEFSPESLLVAEPCMVEQARSAWHGMPCDGLLHCMHH